MAKQNRERGTLQSTLPKSPFLILFLYVLLCTGVATYTSKYSQYGDKRRADDDDKDDATLLLWNTTVKASIGAISSVVGILYTDPFVYGLLFSFSMLCVILIDELFTGQTATTTLTLDVMKQLFQYLSPLFVTFILSKLSSTFKNTIGSVASSKMILNQFNLLVLCTIPLLSLVLGFAQMTAPIGRKEEEEEYSLSMTYFLSLLSGFAQMAVTGRKEEEEEYSSMNMTYIPSIMIGITAFIIYRTYYSKRSHKNGGLVLKTQVGLSVIIGMGILYFVGSLPSIQDWNDNDNNDHDIVESILPFILGATLAVELGAFFAFVADFWYAVGTGQFLMVSLDTAGILFYFVSPVIILLIRFFDKYQHGIDTVAKYLAVQLSSSVLVPLQIMMNDPQQVQIQTETLFLIFTTLPIVIGIPLIHYLCPITGHLFGRTYTHGDPNTKKVAICINFSEYKPLLNKLLKKDNANDDDDNKQFLKDCVLNIFVTMDDLRNSTDMINKLHQSGHNVGISMSPSGSNGCTNLNELYIQYETVVGTKPNWYHTGIGNRGNLPSHFRTASKLGMRSAIWSTLVDCSKTDLSNIDSETIKADLVTHGGGSIVYLDKIDSPEKHACVKTLLSLMDVIAQNGFKLASLSQIIKENRMDL